MATPVQAEFRAINKNGKTCVIIVDEIGFSYSFPKKGKENKTLPCRCSKKIMTKCSAQIIVNEGWITSHKNSHNHEPPEELHKAVPVKLEDQVVQKYFKN